MHQYEVMLYKYMQKFLYLHGALYFQVQFYDLFIFVYNHVYVMYLHLLQKCKGQANKSLF